MTWRALPLVLMLLLVGCATRYECATWWRDGYTNYRIAEDSFLVTFQGNRWTSTEQTERFAMLRAAELTLESGHTHFLILEEKDRSLTMVEFHERPSGSTEPSWIDLSTSSHTTTTTRPQITLRIQCLEGGMCAGAICAEEYLRYNP